MVALVPDLAGSIFNIKKEIKNSKILIQLFFLSVFNNVFKYWVRIWLGLIQATGLIWDSKENLILPLMSRKNIVKMGTKVFSIFVENEENGEKVINRLRPMS